jgi:hypothetical protein
MPSESLPPQSYFYGSSGRRDIGRPRRRWAQQFLYFRKDPLLKMVAKTEEEEEKDCA